MYRGRSVGVVLPAYNEARHIRRVLASLPSFIDRVYAVDDRSTDGTWTIIQAVASGSADPTGYTTGDGGVEAPTSLPDGGVDMASRVIPIRHERNLGAGAAIRTGYRHALRDRVDVVVTMDADGQMNPAHLPRLLDPLVEDRADYSKGNRLTHTEHRARMPRFRRFGNALLTWLTRAASGYWQIGDPQNGYTAITRGALSRISVEQLPDGHDYTNDLLVRLNARELRVADVPMPAEYDDEESTIQYRSFVPRTSRTLVVGVIRRLRTRYGGSWTHPVPALYAVALLGTVTGVVVAIASIFGGLTWSPVAVLLLVSTASLLIAMALDARVNRPLEVMRACA